MAKGKETPGPTVNLSKSEWEKLSQIYNALDSLFFVFDHGKDDYSVSMIVDIGQLITNCLHENVIRRHEEQLRSKVLPHGEPA